MPAGVASNVDFHDSEMDYRPRPLGRYYLVME